MPRLRVQRAASFSHRPRPAGGSIQGSLEHDEGADDAQARVATMEVLRSRKPIFMRLREARQDNSKLRRRLQGAYSTIDMLRGQLMTDTEALATLEREVNTVRGAAAQLSEAIDDTVDIVIPLPTSAAAAAGDALPAWAEYGVAQLFHHVDKDHDMLLCLAEMNELQAALGNDKAYTLRQYRNLCASHGIKWLWRRPGKHSSLSILTATAAARSLPGHADDGGQGSPSPSAAHGGSWRGEGGAEREGVAIDGGMDCNGLIALYSQMGQQAVQRDLAKVGIKPDVRSETIRTVARAAEHLRALGLKLAAAHAHNTATAGTLASAKGRVAEQETAMAQLREQVGLLQAENKRLRMEKQQVAELATRHAAEARQHSADLGRADGAKEELVRALTDMRALLDRQIQEKAQLQREVSRLTAQHSSLHGAVAKSQRKLMELTASKKEQARQYRLLQLKQPPSRQPIQPCCSCRQHGHTAME